MTSLSSYLQSLIDVTFIVTIHTYIHIFMVTECGTVYLNLGATFSSFVLFSLSVSVHLGMTTNPIEFISYRMAGVH